MTSRRRSPFGDIEELLNRLSSELGEEFGSTVPGKPPMDVGDTGDAFVVSVDLPGVEKEDVDLELRDNTLHVTAEHEEETEEVTERYLTRERTRGTLRREVTLPEEVDEEAVKATFENGVLEVDLPKARTDESGTDINIG